MNNLTLAAIVEMEEFIIRKEKEQLYHEFGGNEYVRLQIIINKAKVRLEKAKRIHKVDTRLKKEA